MYHKSYVHEEKPIEFVSEINKDYAQVFSKIYIIINPKERNLILHFQRKVLEHS